MGLNPIYNLSIWIWMGLSSNPYHIGKRFCSVAWFYQKKFAVFCILLIEKFFINGFLIILLIFYRYICILILHAGWFCAGKRCRVHGTRRHTV
jgi:hypothetical protein